MKKLIHSLFVFFNVVLLPAQTFNGNGGSITNDGNPTPFSAGVSGLGNSGNNFGVAEVQVSITHPDMNEITIGLKSPQGIYVELVNNTGIKGANFSSTILSYSASIPITAGTAPYTGSYKPIGHFGRFNTGGACNGTWVLMVKDYNPNGNSGSVTAWSISFSSSAPMPVNFTSSNLPLVFINTGNQSISTNTILCDVGIIDNGGGRNNLTDPKNAYNGKAKINIRGSSSQIYEKKSYKLDLCSPDGAIPADAPLFGMPAESDWVLTSGFADKTLMRNALTQKMFRDMSHYSPRTKFVEVFINGEYNGVYTFTEKIKRSDFRVNIDKVTPLDNNFPFVTGGYIIQINRTDDDGWYSLFPGISNGGAKFYYQYVYPHPEEITQAQKNYIKACMDTFETVMNGPDFADPVKGYRKYIDVTSFADMFIINEYSKNIDGYKLSTFLYKDNLLAGGKIHAGPLWDYDIGWKNANYGNAEIDSWWQYDHPSDFEPLPTWWKRLMDDAYFKNLVWCRWHTFRLQTFATGTLKSYIDQMTGELQEAQARNFVQYPILDQFIFPNPPTQISSSYQSMVNDLKDWIEKRGAWLDNNIPGFCNNVAITDFASEENEITSFPNPFQNEINVNFSGTPDETSVLEIYNVIGEKVWSNSARHSGSGSQTMVIPTDAMQNGTYLLVLNTGTNSYRKKIIKTGN